MEELVLIQKIKEKKNSSLVKRNVKVKEINKNRGRNCNEDTNRLQ